MPRLPEDRLADDGTPAHRYRCRAATCGWEGLIERGALAAAPPAPEPAPRHRLRQATWALAGLAGVALAAVVVNAASHRQGPSARGSGPVVAQGVSHDGDALPADHPMLALVDEAVPAPASSPDPALALRQRCAWGQPGRSPYKGTVEQALNAARLPAPLVQQVAAKIRAHDVSDRVAISNATIRAEASGREYDPKAVVMTYGRTLCMATQVNFKAGHTERADLYVVSDDAGKRYSVMVPDVCGNVSVLAERGKSLPVAVLAAAQALADAKPLRLAGDPKAGDLLQTLGLRDTSAAREVPEPGSLPMVALALAALAWSLRRRRTGR
ncbi:PEP-CTERM sorting domain-containing protein [Ideonella sp. A 288]|uniref:PEP-CTERM sorting domain-containing protein n=1 Tax=Ideonella sp. A 288 TaxID=1962181 RepID=UPI000B4BDABD|nr:PEP-CTERM sorting domain-containing protein [Ideonella sp. A 288]